MTNEIGGIKRGIKERLESIPGLRVIAFAPDDWRDFPVAVIRLESRGASRAGVGRSSFETEFVVTLMAGGSKARDAYDTLDAYMASGGGMSVEAAVDADHTLGGVVDRARLVGVENIRIVRLGGGRYAGADFRIRVEKRTGARAVLELDDGSGVINLMGSPYFASGEAGFAPVERDRERAVEIELAMRESAAGQLRNGLRSLDSMLARAERRSRLGRSSAVRLRRGNGGANRETVEYKVLRGQMELMPELRAADAALRANLGLTVEALGRLPPVSAAGVTLANEQDGANRNYADFTNIPGTHGALAQVRIHDPSGAWSDSGKMWVGRTSGERRATNLFFQAEDGAIERGSAIFEDAGAVWSGSVQPMADASGGECARMEWAKAGRYTTRSAFTLCGRARIAIDSSGIPRGRFRVLARARTDSDNAELHVGHMGFALGWSFGSSSKTPVEGAAVFPGTASEFRTLDLGELTLPPMPAPEGYAAPELNLDVYGALRGGGAANAHGTHHFRWSLDYVMLLPIDEGEVAVSGVGPSERILLDSLSESGAGVYILDESDATIGPADFTGAPFTIGPEDTRIYIARDDISDPSGVKFGVASSYTPLAAGV